MARNFSPTRALGIPPQDYSSYFQDDVGRPDLQPAFEPDYMRTGSGMPVKAQYGGYSGSPFYFTPSDPIASQEIQQATQNRLAALQAQAEMASPEFDPFSAAGRQKRMSYLLQGAINPQLEGAIQREEEARIRDQYRLEALEERKRQHDLQEEYRNALLNKPNKYNVQIHPDMEDALKRIHTEVNPADPEEASKSLNEIISGLPQGMYAHPYVQTAIDRKERAIEASRAKKEALEAHKPTDLKLIERAGEIMGDISDYVDPEDPSKIINKPALLYAMGQVRRNQQAFSEPGVKDEYVNYLRKMSLPSDSPSTISEAAKLLAEGGFGTITDKGEWAPNTGERAPTDQDWSAAKNMVLAKRKQEFEDFKRQHGINFDYLKGPQGLKFQGVSGLPPVANAPTFRSEQEAEAANLPPGTLVIVNGRPARIK